MSADEYSAPQATYVFPAVSLRATWSATDGGKPEEITIDWRDAPPIEQVEAMAALLMFGGAQVEHELGPLPDHLDPALCNATAEPHRGPGHGCAMTWGHDPAEPGGRAHRCRCGGLFATDAETPNVPGQRPRRRDER